MRSYRGVLSFVCWGFLVLAPSALCWGADWVYYYQAEEERGDKTSIEKYYFDRSSVENAQNDVIKLAQKLTVVVAESEERDKRVLQIEMNCSSRKYRVLTLTEFDDAGKEISGDTSQNPAWKKFYLSGVMGVLHDNVCPDKRASKEAAKKKEQKKSGEGSAGQVQDKPKEEK